MNQEQIAGIASAMAALLGGLNEQKPKVWDGLRFERTGEQLRAELEKSCKSLDALLQEHGEKYAGFVRRQKAERRLLFENLDDAAVYVLTWEELRWWIIDQNEILPDEPDEPEASTPAAS